MYQVKARLLIILSIVALVSVLSGCKHTTFPKAPVYRECLYAVNDAGKKVIYCEQSDNGLASEYPATEAYLTKFLMTPLQDVPRLEKYEAEVRSWVDMHCSK